MSKKRKTGPRYRCGKLKATPRVHADTGTDELKARRIALVEAGAPELSSYPLGTLMARKVITLDMHNAGEAYARGYARYSGRYKDCGLEPDGTGGEPDPETVEAEREKHLKACAALSSISRRAKSCVDDIAVFRKLPRWFYSSMRRRAEHHDYHALRDGLIALCKVFYGSKAETQATGDVSRLEQAAQ
jgi:hypothetical protein